MKKFFESLRELSKNPRGKAFLFFGCYIVLFIVIFLIIGFAGNSNYNKTYDKGRLYNFNTNLIKNNNYHYTYKVVSDDVELSSVGDKYKTREMFTYDNKEYYVEDDTYYIKNNGWVKVDNPYKFNKLLDIDNIINLVNYAMYESSTNYQSGKVNYNFLISSNTINKELDNIDSDYDEEPNRIVISTNENSEVEGVSLYLDSYCVMNKLCKNSLIITLNYSQFGEIKEIESQLK